MYFVSENAAFIKRVRYTGVMDQAGVPEVAPVETVAGFPTTNYEKRSGRNKINPRYLTEMKMADIQKMQMR